MKLGAKNIGAQAVVDVQVEMESEACRLYGGGSVLPNGKN